MDILVNRLLIPATPRNKRIYGNAYAGSTYVNLGGGSSTSPSGSGDTTGGATGSSYSATYREERTAGDGGIPEIYVSELEDPTAEIVVIFRGVQPLMGSEYLFSNQTGMITLTRALDKNETLIVIYKKTVTFASAVYRDNYKAIANGENNIVRSALIGNSILLILRGVGPLMSSFYTFDSATGTITFTNALDKNEQIIIIYKS